MPSHSYLLNALDNTLPHWHAPTSLPTYCGSLSSLEEQPLELGQEVAAKVEDNWILAIVSRVDRDNKYVIEDVFEDSQGKLPRHSLHRSLIIPLPCWKPPRKAERAFFNIGDNVLALYPQTTCFYAATVQELPAEDNDNYTLHFADDYFEDLRPRLHQIPLKYVVANRPPAMI